MHTICTEQHKTCIFYTGLIWLASPATIALILMASKADC